MNIKSLTKLGIILGSVLLGIFVVFLILPFILNFFIDKYTPTIVGEINKLSGLSSGLEEIRIVTTPKFTAGLNVRKIELYTPNKEPVFIAENFSVKMSLLPILTKNLRIDVISLENANINLKYDKSGNLELLNYIPQKDKSDAENVENTGLPFGIKLSNHLPDIHIGKCNIKITEGTDNYTINSGKTDVTNFIFNKSIKIKSKGKISLKGREQFNYNVSVFNKIMPNIELNDAVFNPNQQEITTETFNIIDSLKELYNYKVTADANINLKTTNNAINGYINVKNISIIDLTPSNIELNFNGNTIDLNSNIFTAKNEVSILKGKITSGKKPYIDMNFKTNAEIENVLNIVKKFALIFNIKDLQTLSAKGTVNADFNIKSDLKTVNSSGYLKIPSANLYYGLYKIGINNIFADILLSNNNINIKNVSFSILGQPLKLYGTISENAIADLHATADKLNIKGLMIALGQASLLKDNNIYSGILSMDTIIKGKLDKINPLVKLNITNIDIKNIPSDIRLKAPMTNIDITSSGDTFGGNASSKDVKLINPAVTITIPSLNANITPDVIYVQETPVIIDKNKTSISGKITNYMTEKIGLDFIFKGDIKSDLKGDMNINKQTLNLSYATTDMSTIIIPMFDKSKLSFNGKISITGNMSNPILSGTAIIPLVSIPEIPVIMKDMNLKFNGTILHGSGIVREFSSGNIKAEECSADFILKGNDFYLNNLNGKAFDGKISGNIIYNILNTKAQIDFKGFGMNAEKAIEGAAGIKKALSGTLDFDTKLSLKVLDYNDMIKSMTGNLNFNIKNGAFGSIGRFEGLLNANNIITNSLLKNTVASISNATAIATTAEFDKIEGNLSFINGWANLNPIKSAGKSLCYYVTGKFNILNGTTNAVILGRLDAPMVAKLGILGQINASKLLGSTAANILKFITSNPQGEKTENIPSLTNSSTNYQDFKVTFNGGIESTASIKSFKWLSNADLSDTTPQTTKDTVKAVKEAFNTDVSTTVNTVKDSIDTKKQEVQETKEQIKTTVDDFKNLWKNIKSTTKPQASSTKESSQTTDIVSTSESSQTGETEKSITEESSEPILAE